MNERRPDLCDRSWLVGIDQRVCGRDGDALINDREIQLHGLANGNSGSDDEVSGKRGEARLRNFEPVDTEGQALYRELPFAIGFEFGLILIGLADELDLGLNRATYRICHD